MEFLASSGYYERILIDAVECTGQSSPDEQYMVKKISLSVCLFISLYLCFPTSLDIHFHTHTNTHHFFHLSN